MPIQSSPTRVARYIISHPDNVADMVYAGDGFISSSNLIDTIQSAVVIDVLNVAEYVESLAGSEIQASGITIRPPFESMWMEYDDHGMLVASISFLDNGIVSFRGDYPDAPKGIAIIHFLGRFSIAISFIEVDDDGGFGRDRGTHMHRDFEDRDGDLVRQHIYNRNLVVIMAIAFMHCKNVTLEERYPKRHEQREAKRRGEPILKYHEIVIDPHKVQQPSTGANRTDDMPKRSLHITRGHFAHYTEDRPLFGKYVGTFWRPAHVRGSADVGVVKSTYKVKPGI